MLDALGPFEVQPDLAIAVSGGPDSIALALLADAWARERGGSVLALIVDHGLRPESAAEAMDVASGLAAAGIPTRILVWSGVKPVTGVQAAARDARYWLLESACRAAGILHLLLGHQRDDQAETVAMRQATGSGPDGLAGMTPVSEALGVRRLRPLLSVPKARLIATLAAAGRSWVVDPGNLSPTFARGRLRADAGFDVVKHWEASVHHAQRRAVQDSTLAEWLAAHVQPHPLGWARVDRLALRECVLERQRLVLGRLLATVGGNVYPARKRVIQGLGDQLQAAGAGARWSAGGCIVAVRARHLIVTREPAGIHDATTLAPGHQWRWDGRYTVRYRSGPGPLDLACLGAAGIGELPAVVRRRLRSAGIPATALAALPALRDPDGLVGCPPLSPYGLEPRPGVRVTAALKPPLPLSEAAFGGVNVV